MYSISLLVTLHHITLRENSVVNFKQWTQLISNKRRDIKFYFLHYFLHLQIFRVTWKFLIQEDGL